MNYKRAHSKNRKKNYVKYESPKKAELNNIRAKSFHKKIAGKQISLE
jgi:hypothetical protein